MGRKQLRQKFSSRKAKHRAAPNTRRLNVEHLEDRRLLAVVTVTNHLDVIDGDTSSIPNLIATPGPDGISLREAIEAANTDAAADTIDFDNSLSGDTLSLTQGELELTEELTIDASSLSGDLTIDAQQNSRIINISAETGDFALAGLTLTGGYGEGSGGAIYSFSDGLLTVSQSTVRDNETDSPGGGIASLGQVALLDSAVSDNVSNGGNVGGGGVIAIGNITLIDSRVSGNWSDHRGGGLLSFSGEITVANSTIDNNTVEGSGINSGGGIHTSGDVTIINSTVSHNRVSSTSSIPFGGGGISSGGHVTLSHSTFAGNSDSSTGFFSGTIRAGDGITLNHSILADNTTGFGETILGGTGTLEVNYSLIDDTSSLTASQISDINAGTGNLLDVDPLLGPLTNNGGPTKTHALLAGSPAIDAGDPSIAAPPASDQRGAPFRRIADGNADTIPRIDIGAYEVPDTLIVTTHIDEFDGNIDTGTGGAMSLREAIELANLSPKPININFAPSLDGSTIQIDQLNLDALPIITDNLSIDASNLPGGITIHAGHGLDGTPMTGDGIRVFSINDADDNNLLEISLYAISVAGGDIAGEGGGILSRENLLISGSIITDNATTELENVGGGISSRIGVLTLINSYVTNNSTSGLRASGGGIYSDTIANIADSTISGNATRNEVLQYVSPYTIVGNIVANHTPPGASATGGGISANVLTIFSSIISGNSTHGGFSEGGGIDARGELLVENSTVLNNHTLGYNAGGGGIHSRLSNVSIKNSIVSYNSTSEHHASGGGIHSYNGILSIVGSTVSKNSTSGVGAEGGGIYSGKFESQLNIKSTTIDGNTASGNFSDGGGVYAFLTPAITNTTISGNVASGQFSIGGGIFTVGGEASISHSTISNNSASERGGGIGASTSRPYFILSHSIVYGNRLVQEDATSIADDISDGSVELGYSIVGVINSISTETPGAINFINVDPRLGPLADNGGPTKTHALLPGSPAIDAGYSTSSTDQRGFTAPVDLAEYQNTPGGNGRDIGAYEAQTPPSADFDNSGYVGGLDFLAWQRGFGSTDATKPAGNSDDDTDVDASDLAAWSATFGGGPPTAADFDTSGNVGGLDFLTWQRGFGSTTATKPDGDTNNDADVDSDDLDTWKSLFGHQAPLAYTTPPPAPLQAAATAPESQTAPLETKADFQIAQLAQSQEKAKPQTYTSTKRQRVDKTAPHQIASTTYVAPSQAPTTKTKPPKITTKEHPQHKETTDEAFAQLAEELLSDNFPSLSGRG